MTQTQPAAAPLPDASASPRELLIAALLANPEVPPDRDTDQMAAVELEAPAATGAVAFRIADLWRVLSAQARAIAEDAQAATGADPAATGAVSLHSWLTTGSWLTDPTRARNAAAAIFSEWEVVDASEKTHDGSATPGVKPGKRAASVDEDGRVTTLSAAPDATVQSMVHETVQWFLTEFEDWLPSKPQRNRRDDDARARSKRQRAARKKARKR